MSTNRISKFLMLSHSNISCTVLFVTGSPSPKAILSDDKTMSV